MKKLTDTTVTDLLDSYVHLKGVSTWDDLVTSERLNVLETILINQEMVDIDDMLSDLGVDELRSVLYYFLLSNKNSEYEVKMHSYLQDMIDSLLSYIEDDVNSYLEMAYFNTYGQETPDEEEGCWVPDNISEYAKACSWFN